MNKQNLDPMDKNNLSPNNQLMTHAICSMYLKKKKKNLERKIFQLPVSNFLSDKYKNLFIEMPYF